jgi:antibiotic biosynthesis monooxygenase (ABM) superfamily enzyme
MNKDSKVGQYVELIRLKVTAENKNAFLEGRVKVDEFTSTLPGYMETEILNINAEEFVILIRWKDEASVRDAQKITANSAVISDWLKRTAQFMAFETTNTVYSR